MKENHNTLFGGVYLCLPLIDQKEERHYVDYEDLPDFLGISLSTMHKYFGWARKQNIRIPFPDSVLRLDYWARNKKMKMPAWRKDRRPEFDAMIGEIRAWRQDLQRQKRAQKRKQNEQH